MLGGQPVFHVLGSGNYGSRGLRVERRPHKRACRLASTIFLPFATRSFKRYGAIGARAVFNKLGKKAVFSFGLDAAGNNPALLAVLIFRPSRSSPVA